MPQVSLYIDKETLEKIEERAHKNHISISKWVGNNLKRLIQDDYPEDFFGLFGSIEDDSFARPAEINFAEDTTRMII